MFGKESEKIQDELAHLQREKMADAESKKEKKVSQSDRNGVFT